MSILKVNDVYTQYKTIVNEIQWYESQLRGLRVHSPFDMGDYSSSKTDLKSRNFYKYFKAKSSQLQLKSYTISGYNTELLEEGAINANSFSQYDVVITKISSTNFILFMKLLMKSNIKFLVLGPENAICSINILDNYVKGKFRLGYSLEKKFLDSNGIKGNSNINYIWYTNLQVNKNHLVQLHKRYSETEHPMIEKTDIIYVDNKKNIPFDYNGRMCVPLSFISCLIEKQFKFFGILRNLYKGKLFVNGKHVSDTRIVIKKVINTCEINSEIEHKNLVDLSNDNTNKNDIESEFSLVKIKNSIIEKLNSIAANCNMNTNTYLTQLIEQQYLIQQKTEMLIKNICKTLENKQNKFFEKILKLITDESK